MNRDNAEAGAEHLQNAARELIAAARLFLDAAEEVVDDPQVVSEFGGAVRSLVGDLAKGSPGAGRTGSSHPFDDDLDEDPEQEPGADGTADGGNANRAASGPDRSGSRSNGSEAPSAQQKSGKSGKAGKSAKSGKARSTEKRTESESRVRRIAVD